MKKVSYLIYLFIAAAFALAHCGVASAAKPPASLYAQKAPKNAMWIDELDAENLKKTGGPLRVKEGYWGGPIMLGRMIYHHGFGTMADSFIHVNLNGACTRFAAAVGVNEDRKKGAGSVIFQVWLDGKKAAESPLMRSGDDLYYFNVDVTGANHMILVADGTADGTSDDSASWGGALLYLDPASAKKPEAMKFQDEPAMQIAHTDFKKLGIHGPRITGSTPGRPFIFRIPATGVAPLKFAAKGLPDGLVLDEKEGVISGSLKKDGSTVVELSVSDKSGTATRKLTIVGGTHKLALTPPMGWNSWNVWGLSVDDKKVRDTADVMINSGLASFGFAYVNIDDGWEAPARAPDGEIPTNEKFPDMKSTADYVHSKGLKIGIYSSPGPRTCGGYIGSYEHEFQDAATWAKWGIDYIKYDWCSYGGVVSAKTREDYTKPYVLMRNALDAVDRDIVYSLCQYGMDKVWEWGAEIGGDLWRTTGDINDNWDSMLGNAEENVKYADYAGPGRWNDPDMLEIGNGGMTDDEYRAHMSLWAVMAAPLMAGNDLRTMTPATKEILMNREVIAVDQDPMGVQGRKVWEGGDGYRIYSRPLAGENVRAVVLLNGSSQAATLKAEWKDLSLLPGRARVRDLWAHADRGVFRDSYSTRVPPHGAVMVKITRLPVR